MHTDIDKINTSQLAVNADRAAFSTPQGKNSVQEAKNAQKTEDTRAKEDKKAHEFGTVCLLYKERTKKAPKSISIHSFDLKFVPDTTKLFVRYVKMQAKIVASEIKTEREIKYNEAQWQKIKKIFNAQLGEIRQKRQQKEL